MSSERLVIRPARLQDLDELVGIYQAAQRWLAEQGSDQWAKNTESKKIRSSLTERSAEWSVTLRKKMPTLSLA